MALLIKDENYYQISGWMITKLNLKGATLSIFAIIYGFSQDGESVFDGSRQYLSNFINSSKPTVDKALNELYELNYIIKTSKKFNNITLNTYKVNLPLVKEICNGGKETLQGGGKETLHNNKELNNNNNNNKIKENIKEIFNYWNEQDIIQHKDLNEDLVKIIDKSLKTNSVEDIKRYILRYSEVYKNQNYYFNYKWTLKEFLKQSNCMNDFKDDGSKWLNYQQFLNKTPIQKQDYPKKEAEVLINERDLIACIGAGWSDRALMEVFNITAEQLAKYKK